MPNLKIIYPNGGEVWEGGRPYNISWEAQDISGNIEIKMKGGSGPGGWYTVSPSIPAAEGRFQYTVPDNLGWDEFKIHIRSLDSQFQDASDSTFTIIRPSTFRIIDIKPICATPYKLELPVKYHIPESHPWPCYIGAFVPDRESRTSTFPFDPAGRKPDGIPKGLCDFNNDFTVGLRYVGSNPYTSSTIEIVLYDTHHTLTSKVFALNHKWTKFDPNEISEVLDFDSMYEVRQRVRMYDWAEILKELYCVYSGCQSLTEKPTCMNRILDKYRWIRDDDKDFLIHLCHMIWAERHAALPWSIRNLSRENVRLLAQYDIDLSGWSSDNQGTKGCWRETRPEGPDPISREWYKMYPLTRYLIEGSSGSSEALSVLTKWIMKNFFHAYNWGPDDTYDWDRYDKPRFLLTLEDFLHERIANCHLCAKTLCAMLRSVNIPAIELHDSPGAHGIVYVPTLNRYIHGDYLAMVTILPDPSIIIMSLDELEHWIRSERGYASLFYHLRSENLIHMETYLHRRDRDLHVFGELPEDEVVRRQIITDLEEYMLPDSPGHFDGFALIEDLDDLPHYINLKVIDIGLDFQGKLVICLQNEGNQIIPTGRGNILISIDDTENLPQYKLSEIDDQSFRKPGGLTEFNTNYIVTGGWRRVTVCVTELNGPCRGDVTYRKMINPMG